MYLSLSLILSLTCLLMYPAPSHSGGADPKHLAKCKDPKGVEGDTLYDGCTKKTCIHAKGTRGVWAGSDATDICCAQNGTMFETGTIIQTSYPMPCQLVSLQCQMIDDRASIVPQLKETCKPPYKVIGAKVDALSQKMDEMKKILEGECTGTTSPDQAIMITGGFSMTSVELYNPVTNFSCFLPYLPSPRWSSVNNKFLVCGGDYNSDCVSLNDGTWVQGHNLTTDRTRSSLWDSSEGLVIMGGSVWPAGDTAEILRPDFSSEYYFSLSASRYDACSITDYDTDTVILTGGDPTYSLVERYGHSGLKETLPSLNYPRMAHGCSSYIRDGKRVFLVAGGYKYYDHYYTTTSAFSSPFLSSTEIFTYGSDTWTVVTPLPEPLSWTEGITLNNKIYLFGNDNWSGDPYNTDFVYVWDGETEEWTYDGSIMEGRSNVGLSLVPLASGIMDYCTDDRDFKDKKKDVDSPVDSPNKETVGA